MKFRDVAIGDYFYLRGEVFKKIGPQSASCGYYRPAAYIGTDTEVQRVFIEPPFRTARMEIADEHEGYECVGWRSPQKGDFFENLAGNLVVKQTDVEFLTPRWVYRKAEKGQSTEPRWREPTYRDFGKDVRVRDSENCPWLDWVGRTLSDIRDGDRPFYVRNEDNNRTYRWRFAEVLE